jgi:hypothetical protein
MDHYNGLVEASMQSNSKGSVGLFITVHYNNLVDASMQGYSKGSFGPLIPVYYNE